ncbi:MAG: MarR family transcriptional regulator [bacterium]|nr:MarR family transcriptional regulator [bacterium]
MSRPLTALPCACATLRRAARSVTQLYDTQLRPSGLRATQFTILQALSLAGATPQGALGDILALDSTTLTRALKLLAKEGWIASDPGKDRRQRYWKLTPTGRQQLLRATPYWERAQLQLKNALSKTAWENLVRGADAATRAVRKTEMP